MAPRRGTGKPESFVACLSQPDLVTPVLGFGIDNGMIHDMKRESQGQFNVIFSLNDAPGLMTFFGKNQISGQNQSLPFDDFLNTYMSSKWDETYNGVTRRQALQTIATHADQKAICALHGNGYRDAQVGERHVHVQRAVDVRHPRPTAD